MNCLDTLVLPISQPCRPDTFMTFSHVADDGAKRAVGEKASRPKRSMNSAKKGRYEYPSRRMRVVSSIPECNDIECKEGRERRKGRRRRRERYLSKLQNNFTNRCSEAERTQNQECSSLETAIITWQWVQ